MTELYAGDSVLQKIHYSLLGWGIMGSLGRELRRSGIRGGKGEDLYRFRAHEGTVPTPPMKLPDRLRQHVDGAYSH